jgi:hypothetical protein
VVKARILLLALVVAVLPVLGVASPASAVTGDVTVSAPDVALESWQTGKTDLSFHVTAPNPNEFLYYDYEVRVDGPKGLAEYRTGEEYYGGQWLWPVYLSPEYDGYGTYTITATVTYYPLAGNVPIDTKTTTSSFSFSGPPKPPTPPPTPVMVKGTVFGTPFWMKFTRSFSATIQGEYRTLPASQTPIPATFRLWVGNKVVDTATLGLSQTDRLETTLPRKKRTKRYLVQIEINGQVVYSRYCKVKGKQK